MLSYSQAFYELKNKLQPLYDEREAVAIAHELLHHITNLDKMQRLARKDDHLTADQQQQFESTSAELLQGKPLQYVIGTAWFMGREYTVNEHVLIPRPETEELVNEVMSCKPQVVNEAPIHILDIGTGSGCIAITLKLEMSGAVMTSCDISVDALTVAKENAKGLGADVTFVQLDFLNASERNKLGKYDVIVSNPPYIPENERKNIHANVKDWEPSLALFVPDEDSLVFYKAIAEFGREHLNSNGYIYCELDTAHAFKCKTLFENAGYRDVEIKKDMHGNWRMLKCKVGIRE